LLIESEQLATDCVNRKEVIKGFRTCTEGGASVEGIIEMFEELPAVPIPCLWFDNFALYRCDPEKNTHCMKTGCHAKGGPCMLTARKECAK